MSDILLIIIAILGSASLNSVVVYLLSSRTKKKEKNDGSARANRIVMKDRLRFLCTQYINQNWIYEDELEDLIAMHDCYHDDLSGNGYLNDLMNRVKHLEIRGIGVK